MDIKNIREKIDNIDNELAKLLNNRMKYVKQIGKLKQISQGSIYRPEREKQIIERLASQNHEMLNKEEIEAIFLEIFATSRKIEMPEVVAYLGPKGSYTHQIARSRFGCMQTYLPLSSINAVFKVLSNKEAKYGIVPIENSTDGVVGITLDCLGIDENIKIVAECNMKIHHSFISLEEKLQNVKKIFLHPNTFNQCQDFIEEHMLSEVEFIPVTTTAQAAKNASLEKNSAAICSKIAAKLYNVPVLFEKIEDKLANTTRFLILSDFKNQKSSHDKTSILARLDDKPGSLAKFLSSFEKYKINLTKIESRPSKEKGYKSVFYIDFQGHIDDEHVKNFIDENKIKNEIKWLGSYVKENANEI